MQVIAPPRRALEPGLDDQTFDREMAVRRLTGYVFACVSINAQAFAAIPLRLYSLAKPNELRAFEARELTKADLKKCFRSKLRSAPVERALYEGRPVHEIQDGHPWTRLQQDPNDWLEWANLLELLSIYGQTVGDAHWYVAQNELGVPVSLWPLMSHRLEAVRQPSDEKRPGKPLVGWRVKGGRNSLVFPEEAKQGFQAYQTVGNTDDIILPVEDVIHFRYCANPLDPYGRGLSSVRAGSLAIDLYALIEEYQQELVQRDGIPPWIVKQKEIGGDNWDKEFLEKWSRQRMFAGSGMPGVIPFDVDVETIGLSPKELAFREGLDQALRELAAVFRVPMPFLDTRNMSFATDKAAEYRHRKLAIEPLCLKVEAELNNSIIWPSFGKDFFVAFDPSVPEDETAALEQHRAGIVGGWLSPNEVRADLRLEPSDQQGADKLWLQSGMAPIENIAKGIVAPPAIVPPRATRAVLSEDSPPLEKIEPLERILVGYFHRQRDAVLERLTASKRAIDPADPFGEDAVRELDNITWPEIHKRVNDGVRIAYGKTADMLGKLPLIDLELPAAAAFLKEHRTQLSDVIWPSVNDETRRAVSKAIADGMTAEESLAATAGRIEAIFGEAETWRAMMVARTETIRALNVGQEAAFAASGVVGHKRWDAAEDSCDVCRALHGQVAPIGRTFSNGLDAPPRHPNCLCQLIPLP